MRDVTETFPDVIHPPGFTESPLQVTQQENDDTLQTIRKEAVPSVATTGSSALTSSTDLAERSPSQPIQSRLVTDGFMVILHYFVIIDINS